MRPAFQRSATDISLAPLGKDGQPSSSNFYPEDRKHSIGEEEHGKTAGVSETDDLPAYDGEDDFDRGRIKSVSTPADIVTSVLHVDDDPSINPWTFRMFFLGEYCHAVGSLRAMKSYL